MNIRDNYNVMMAVRSAKFDSRKMSECLMPFVGKFVNSMLDWDEIRLGSSLRVEFSREEFPRPDMYHNYLDYDFYFLKIGRTYVRVTSYGSFTTQVAVA